MKRIIVTGISGFLGQHFVDAPRSAWDIHGIYQHYPFQEKDENFRALDLGDINHTQSVFDQIDAEAIVHLAAISKPNICQRNPDYSYKVNVVVPAFLAQYAYAKKIPFYFISTDLVFDGKNGPYQSSDQPRPINLYGQQKYEAEQRILAIHPASAVLRLPLLYGYTPNRSNFLIDWMEHLRQGKSITAFTDEYRSPLYVRDAVRGILQLLRKRKTGIWHLGGPERLSRYEMALQIASTIGADKALIQAKKQSDIELSVARPADVSLVCKQANVENFHARTFCPGRTIHTKTLRAH